MTLNDSKNEITITNYNQNDYLRYRTTGAVCSNPFMYDHNVYTDSLSSILHPSLLSKKLFNSFRHYAHIHNRYKSNNTLNVEVYI